MLAKSRANAMSSFAAHDPNSSSFQFGSDSIHQAGSPRNGNNQPIKKVKVSVTEQLLTKRTVPSIPTRDKEDKDIGPWSYSPRDDFTKPGGGSKKAIIASLAQAATTTQSKLRKSEEEQLRQRTLRYLASDEKDKKLQAAVAAVYRDKNATPGKLIKSGSCVIQGQKSQDIMQRLNQTYDAQNESTPRQERERTIMLKTSKVSILQTARVLDRNKLMTEQRLIPLKQQTQVKLTDPALVKPSSQFASKVFR